MRPLWFALLVVLAACSNRERVVVVDPSGRPVEGATVTPAAMSVNGAPTLTDAAGEALVDVASHVAPPRWILVAKSGFVDVQAPLPTTWPLRVTLTPTPKVIE